MALKDTLANAYSAWMGAGPEDDVAISSRVRLARALAGFPFPHRLRREKAEEVIHAVALAIRQPQVIQKVGRLELVRMTELSPIERQILVEKHLISPDLTKDAEKRAVVLSEDETISIMVNEEDHLRIQCLLPGLQLEQAWRLADTVDTALQSFLAFATSERLGFLTACPTNVGTGLRASVMLHLPALAMARQIKEALTAVAKLGLVVRGLYGEGTEAKGNFFQISNQITLGQKEDEIVANLVSVTRRIIAQERTARQVLYRERREMLEDRVCRAYGALRHARVISSEEALRLLSDVRLGIDLGVIQGVPRRLLTELMVMTRPAFLVRLAGKDLPPFPRDVYRAQLIRERLKQF